MNIKQFQNIAILSIASLYFVSCDQIVQPTPSTIDGEWKCEENHYETGKTNYYINIEYSDSTKKGIKIQNFNNLSGYCSASISGSNISIPNQTVDKHIIKGSGLVSTDFKTITFDYNDDAFGNGGGHVTSKCVRL